MHLNQKETIAAQDKQALLCAEFQSWIWSDEERKNCLVRIYNDKFNRIRPREYDGSILRFSGMNTEIELRPHQTNAVARVLYGGNALLAHKVGVGKTFEIIAAAQESKRLGLCNKSMIVVPNHLIKQWASEYLRLYPTANILVADKKDFEMKKRKTFCSRIATGDYDKIEDKLSIKELAKMVKKLEKKLSDLSSTDRKDSVIGFEEMGIDRLFVDESHFYKNLYFYTKMTRVGGIAQSDAKKSSDLYMKCRYLDEITGGKGIIFATGTPISNSMVEMFSVQKYLQYNELTRLGMQHFDNWASAFGETVTALELAPEGKGYQLKTRFSKFYNLPELMTIFKEVADIQTADMLKLPVPEVDYKNISVPPSQEQKDMVMELAKRAEAIRKGAVKADQDNMLNITNEGRKLALDQRIMNPFLPDNPDSKVNACVSEVYEIYQRYNESKATQLIFCDLSTPNKTAFNVYDDIKKKLISKGIPAHEIAYIHDADTDEKKKILFNKVRSGNIRVLLGSTQKMGAGTNVQDRLIAIHNLDCPWRPSDVGRILRTFKIKKNVEVTDNGKIII